jgi:hypothetical protein
MKEGRLLFVLFVRCVVSPKLHSASFAALLEYEFNYIVNMSKLLS